MAGLTRENCADTREKMVIRFMESAAYKGGEFERNAVELIKAGYVAFYPPDYVTVTKYGFDQENQ